MSGILKDGRITKNQFLSKSFLQYLNELVMNEKMNNPLTIGEAHKLILAAEILTHEQTMKPPMRLLATSTYLHTKKYVNTVTINRI